MGTLEIGIPKTMLISTTYKAIRFRPWHHQSFRPGSLSSAFGAEVTKLMNGIRDSLAWKRHNQLQICVVSTSAQSQSGHSLDIASAIEGRYRVTKSLFATFRQIKRRSLHRLTGHFRWYPPRLRRRVLECSVIIPAGWSRQPRGACVAGPSARGLGPWQSYPPRGPKAVAR
jgi:hypothetical protein